jgi:carboxylesterase
MAEARNGAEAFWIEGGPVGALLIHGFMGLPGELRPLGESLAAHGLTVGSVLLARHGQNPETMAGVRWREWYLSARESLAELQRHCERVVVIGYSMGGLLALRLAAHESIDGVITLAGALQLAGGWQLRVLPVARYAMPWFYPLQNADFRDSRLRADLAEKMGAVDFDDPAVVAGLKRSIRIPTAAIHELVKLGASVRRDLPRVHVPALVLQGRRDETVLPQSAPAIYDRLGSDDKELAWFERSGHLLPNDVERAAVERKISDWIDTRFEF